MCDNAILTQSKKRAKIRDIIIESDPICYTCNTLDEDIEDGITWIDLNVPLYNVNIDFNISSKEWRKNKTYRGNGNFTYCCPYLYTGTGRRCGKINCTSLKHRSFISK
jgi:hypothetical protein